MSFNTWTPTAVASEARPWAARPWRVVEAQHVASTMKIVDDTAEQELLEKLLDESKPPLPVAAAELDFLLATPFRYDPLRGGSRFRAATDPGVFYGAQSVRTACAEIAWWRWKFLCDAADLDQLQPVAHTAFRAAVRTTAVDLRRVPFDQDAALWTDPSGFAATQAFARAAREASLGAIVYRSLRDPLAGWCAAILRPSAFASRKPDPHRQTWWIAVRQDAVLCGRDGESLVFPTERWL